MRLCKVTETGLEFVGDTLCDSMATLEKTMRNHPENFEANTEYTLLEKRPSLHIETETKTKVVRTDGK